MPCTLTKASSRLSENSQNSAMIGADQALSQRNGLAEENWPLYSLIGRKKLARPILISEHTGRKLFITSRRSPRVTISQLDGQLKPGHPSPTSSISAVDPSSCLGTTITACSRTFLLLVHTIARWSYLMIPTRSPRMATQPWPQVSGST